VSLDYIEYHDKEWGVPVYDDRVQFEFLMLEGAQAGLSWSTILNKREGYRKAFADFDVEKVARFTKQRVERLLADPAIVRNRLKVESAVSNARAFINVQEDAVSNARAFINVQEEFGSFSKYIWGFVDGTPVQNKFRKDSDVPATSPESDAAVSSLWAARSFTRTCRPPVSSTITSSAAFVTSHARSSPRKSSAKQRAAPASLHSARRQPIISSPVNNTYKEAPSMSEEINGKPPVSFWIVAGVALAWNLIGLFMYYSGVSATPEQLKAVYSPEQFAAIEATPVWVTSAFATATTLGVVASIVLLLRKALAFLLFVASFFALLIQDLYLFLLSDSLAVFGPSLLVIQGSVFVGGVIWIWYASLARKKGWIA
jgi:DNA-3-methyladenine glycosylase I